MPYTIIADMHTHTSASAHAYSSLAENAEWAKRRGLFALAKTDHAPALPDSAHEWHLQNTRRTVGEYVNGVRIFRGAEANLKGADGSVDLPDKTMAALEWVIASCHEPVMPRLGEDGITEAWLNITKNPLIDCVGHAGDERYRFDYERVIKEFAHYGKVVEFNHHSFNVRRGSAENCAQIARLCKKYGVLAVVSSDAHFAQEVGRFWEALRTLEEAGFPEELLLNGGPPERLADYISARLKEKERRLASLNKG